MNLEKEDDESEKTNNNTIFGGKASVYANLTSNVIYMRRDENSHPRYGHYFFSIGIHLNQDYCEIDLAKRL